MKLIVWNWETCAPLLIIIEPSIVTFIYCCLLQMKRKGVGIRQVYDARALRVVIGDKKGKLHGAAVKCCYNLLDIVHRLKRAFLPLPHPTHTKKKLQYHSFWLKQFIGP